MATPGTETSHIETDAPPHAEAVHFAMSGTADDGVGGGRHTGARRDWVTAASFIFGGITAIGFLVIVIGEYLAASAATVLAGTTVICLGGIAWGIAALILICQLIRQRASSNAVAHK